MSAGWEWTDDPTDPCTYDVLWVDPNDVNGTAAVPDVDAFVPMMPDGIACRVYRGVHDECAAEVEEYQREHDRERVR